MVVVNYQNKTGNYYSALLAHCMNAKQDTFKLNVFSINRNFRPEGPFLHLPWSLLLNAIWLLHV